MVDKNPIVYDIILPDFVAKIMDLPFGYTMNIKGDAGTGKSTFAMEVCMQNLDRAALVFVSTRANLQDLKTQYTAFVQKMGQAKIKDLDTLGMTEDKLKLLNVDTDKLLNIFFDFEKIIKDINAKPNQKIIVVIDSIEKMITAIKKREPLTTDVLVYETLISYARKFSLKLFIIAETSQKSQTDYLVDGIVTLYRDIQTVPDRILRTMEVQKLRNIVIDQQVILFTLYQGRFRAIPYLKPRLALLSADQKVKTMYDLMVRNQLSQMFFVNLFQAKKIYTEITSDSNEVLILWHVIFVVVALLNKISVVYMPPADMNVGRFLKALKTAFGEDLLRKYFKVGFFPSPKTPEWMPEYMLTSQSDDILEEFRVARPALESLRKVSGMRGNLVIMPLDSIFIKYNHDTLPGFFQNLQREGILVDEDCLLATNLLTKEMDPLHVRFAESFSSRILFTMRGIQVAKTQVMYWVKLPRPAYALVPTMNEKAIFTIDKLDIMPIM